MHLHDLLSSTVSHQRQNFLAHECSRRGEVLCVWLATHNNCHLVSGFYLHFTQGTNRKDRCRYVERQMPLFTIKKLKHLNQRASHYNTAAQPAAKIIHFNSGSAHGLDRTYVNHCVVHHYVNLSTRPCSHVQESPSSIASAISKGVPNWSQRNVLHLVPSDPFKGSTVTLDTERGPSPFVYRKSLGTLYLKTLTSVSASNKPSKVMETCCVAKQTIQVQNEEG